MSIKRFEDLEIWQDARELCKLVFRVTSVGSFCIDFKFRDQMKAASGSAMDNIAEGFDKGGHKGFLQFLSFSKGSFGAERSQSYKASEWRCINEARFNELLEITDKFHEIHSII